MGFDKNHWNRKYHWSYESNNFQKISAEKVDKDTDDMCNNGLAKLLTQTVQGGRPTSRMSFDGHKI
ncbi:hypothetical protein AGMMS49936_09960 [Endomicrobiia bacterium]|nr:hypothetical protein AGMMS49936_09960 [Endomicrobiia bacterium]